MKLPPNLLRYICLIIFMAAGPAYARPTSDFIHLADPANMMSQSVFALAKDRDGFLWIASRSGITRYDGHNYRHYTLAESEISQDSDGQGVGVRNGNGDNIWAFTNSGKIYFYTTDSDSFRLVIDLGDANLRPVILYDLFEDDDNILWLATNRGLLKFDPRNESSLKPITAGTVLASCILPMEGSRMLVGTSRGIMEVDRASGTASDAHICPGRYAMSLFFDPMSGLLWIGTLSNGVMVWDMGAGVFVDMPELTSRLQAPVKTIRRLDGDTLLAGLDGRGVYSINIREGTCSLLLCSDDSYGGVLKANSVYTILVDNNNIWVGTYTGGVTLVRNNETYEWVRHIPHEHQSIRGTHVYAIHEDRDGDMWYATEQGVSFYETATGRWRHFLEDYNSFLTLCEDNRGLVWAGGYNTGLYCLDKEKGVVRFIPSLSGREQLDCIYASYYDEKGDLWLGCLRTPLARISWTGGSESVEFYDITSVKSISPYGQNSLFVSTSNGFYLIDKLSGRRSLYFDNVSQKGIRSNSFIHSAVSIGQYIWFGTEGGGLNRIDPGNGHTDNFSTYDGLTSNFIYGIIKDDEEMLWVSTAKGIFCFDPFECRFLFNLEGLPAHNFLFMSFTRLSDGRMAFGGTEGAVIFDPVQARRMSQVRPGRLIISDFTLFYEEITPNRYPEVLPAPVDRIDEIKLSYNQNSFSFGFVSPDIYSTHNYTYRYKLDGFDDQWINSAGSLRASYTNIPPGRYVFRVRCNNGGAGITVAERVMEINISQPFWNTAWAWGLYLLMAGGLVMWAWMFYNDRLQRRQSREKIDFFVNIAHDIRTPLSLVLGPLDNLEEEPLSEKGRRHLRLARQNGGKLMTLVNQLLDFHKDTALGSMKHSNLSVLNIKKVLREKVSQFGPMADAKDIDLKLELPAGKVYVETRINKLERILDNLLSNAIKYSRKGEQVIVWLKTAQRRITVEVQDFGIGINRKEQNKIFKQIYRARNAVNSQETGSGIGLVYVHKLAHQIRADLRFTSEENKGTTFSISFRNPHLAGMELPQDQNEPSVVREKGRQFFTDSYSILIVEDNDDMRNYLVDVLSGEYKLYSVPSAERAQEFFRNNMADLVITDIMMDGMKGDELCRWLKNNIETSHVCVIMLTALAGKDNMVDGFAMGADDYITKPFDIDLLRPKVRNIFSSRAKLRRHYLSRHNLPVAGDHAEESVPVPKAAGLDEQFLTKCIGIVNENISNADFTIVDLCREMAMSRTLIYEKLRALLGQSPSEFVKLIRLSRANELLRKGGYSVSDVAAMTGFPDPKYFSTIFKKYYGLSPSKIAV